MQRQDVRCKLLVSELRACELVSQSLKSSLVRRTGVVYQHGHGRDQYGQDQYGLIPSARLVNDVDKHGMDVHVGSYLETVYEHHDIMTLR